MESSDPKPDRKAKGLGGRISLQTLIIASIASAAASFAASRIWGAGTIVSAAATPVVVALVSEFLRRPVQTVAETAKKVPAVQTSLPTVKRIIATPIGPTHAPEQATPTPPQQATPTLPQQATPTPPEQATPTRPEQPSADTAQRPPANARPRPSDVPEEPDRPPEAAAASAPVVEPEATKTTAERWRPRWRLAIVTGLLAFAIVVAIYTVPDLLAGRSITGNGAPTTFFGGTTTVSKKTTSTSTVTTTSPTTTVTKTSPTTVTKTAPTTTSTSTSTSTSTTSTTTPPGAATTQTTTSTTASTTPTP
jgi:hypothetical protein